MVDFNKLLNRTPEERAEMRASVERTAKAREQRTEMMANKLYDQMARGFITGDWNEAFIESVHSRINAGLPLTAKQEAKLEELFERF